MIYGIVAVFGYFIFGGIFARLTWPLQQWIDERAKAKDPSIMKTTWSEQLAQGCILWPLMLTAYIIGGIALIFKAIFSIGLPKEDLKD